MEFINEFDDLKKRQLELKKIYQANPEKAFLTLKAEGILGENVSCKIASGKPHKTAGLHPYTGGDGSLACSSDMLLESLVACAGVTLNSIAFHFGVTLKNTKIIAEGDLDFRGTLGVDRTAPVGFTKIRLRFEIDSEVSPDMQKKMIDLTERYCVVYQTLINRPEISLV
ncbi:OsmC family protein [Bdellovibrio reynosensis]|uniref:OsmC family protein n=1 Tax=Bdellovibrio reynosensis TaxID=2835041 RepID=A0ABY4CDC0_9BACT|nr:OsmC family protein [Bdellovibrio reynosensis]UOF02779.1 OsmC family protein [Bdellovibrio reynosensis]